MKSIITLVIIALSFQISYADDLPIINYGAPPSIDGAVDNGEWSDASEVTLNVQDGQNISVMFKYDYDNFYIKFEGTMHSAPYYIGCPEVLINTDNSDSDKWQSTDWWFHVSATECWAQGQYGDYTSCTESNPDWGGSALDPNTAFNIIEMWISFDKINIDPATTETIKLAFDITNTQSFWAYWPQTADKDSPGGWQTFEFAPESPVEEYAPIHKNIVYPNPLPRASTLNIKYCSDIFCNIETEIIDLLGHSAHHDYHSVQPGPNTISLSDLNLPEGAYIVLIKSDGKLTGSHYIMAK